MPDLLDSIWGLQDDNEFIAALTDHVAKKCGYGERLEGLSGPERVFYLTQCCEMEINNGGFSQLFFNLPGFAMEEIPEAFAGIGAPRTAELCRGALAVFGRQLPADAGRRRDLLEQLENGETDALLSQCDEAFSRYEEDLNALNRAYVMRNRAEFS